ncbi:winged helix-turn-helix transcriptional regulator [[Clostridium] innocuum]|jgi:DNA-binding HxlR family transcriptional regulator|nr:winged helix-turn-helix transcriptional regulator [[Clostridium] innocuum]
MFLIGCTQEVLMMKVTAYKDPLTLSVDIAQEREKALVLWEMEKRKKRLEELCKAIPSMLKKEIMEQLDELIALGLVSRIVHVHKKPTMIEYALTNRGAMLLKCLRKMMDVGIGIMMDYHMEEILIQEGYIERVEVASESDAETLQNA